MRKVFTITALLLTSYAAIAQQKPVVYNFEGIAFNNKALPLVNADMQMRIWIRNPKAGGKIVYEEYQTVSTNQNGLFFLHIGLGKVISGSMSMMASETDSRFMKFEMASIGETTGAGPIRFKCIKCRRSTDRYLPRRVEEFKPES